MTTHPTTEPSGFYGLGIAPQFLEAIRHLKFHTPTPIQQKAIPVALEGKDLVGIAQTGTGKTLAFGIPVLQRFAQTEGRGLVLVPTRELAVQVHHDLVKVAPKTKMAVLIGGASMHLQIQALKQHPRILVATPGRLIDHMEERRVHLGDVRILVLDEADRMLDMGFAPQIQKILRTIPRERQTMLFSATMPEEITKLAASYMKLPVQVEIAKSGTAAEGVTHELFVVSRESKRRLLEKVLAQHHGSTLVFSRTKIGARKITRVIRDMGHRAAEIHSDLSFGQRREALEGFRSGKYRILVATDIASRGIDVRGIELVLNYDLPEDSGNYVHRIGRTGRAGNPGHAISFAMPDQEREVRSIERLIRATLPVSEHPELPKESFLASRVQPRGGMRVSATRRSFRPRRR
ncbi:MAG TPA: DEAD/DEAH box helicase [Candidatus Omnitrophota bacterium]|nr:DEAD/DEAH box helicase [Candidatus Omnitrophota bacterium]